MLAHAFKGVTGSTNNPPPWSVCTHLCINKNDPKTNRKKTHQNVKMSFQGSKKTSKMEPKVVPGRDFSDFCQSLFSCNTTRFLFDFHGFWLPRGGRKTKKKQLKKSNEEKKPPKRIFSNKRRKVEPKWGPIWTPNSPPICPRGVIFPTWGTKAPKEGPRAPKETSRASKRMQKRVKEHWKGNDSNIELHDTETKLVCCLLLQSAVCYPKNTEKTHKII